MRNKRFKQRVARNRLLEKLGNSYLEATKDETLSVYDRFAGFTDGFMTAQKFYKVWKITL